MAVPSSKHAYLKQKIYESDDTACFITRERILQKLDLQYRTYYAYDREARILADLLDQIDTPVDPQDVIVGRMTLICIRRHAYGIASEKKRVCGITRTIQA